jgi:hypothetical protein
MKKLVPTLAAGVLAATSASAQTSFFYDFNNTTSAGIRENFIVNTTSTAENQYTATDGLNASGAINRTTGGDTFVYYRNAIGQFTNPGDIASVSYYWNGFAQGNGGNDFLGFSTATVGNPTAFAPAGVKARLNNTNFVSGAATSNTSYQFLTSNTSAAATTTTDSNTFSLSTAVGTATAQPGGTGAQWYFMTLSLTYKGGNNFDIASSLFNSSNTGAVGSELDSYSVSDQAIVGLANTNIFSGFQVYSAGGSPTRAQLGDNFSTSFTPVPEPTAAIMLLSGTGMLLGFRRGRRTVG